MGEFLLDVSAVRLPCRLGECREKIGTLPPTSRVTLGDKLPTLRLVTRHRRVAERQPLPSVNGRPRASPPAGGGASPEQLSLSVTEQQTGRQQMGTDGDVTQTMMDGYPLVSPKLLPLHFTRCSREVQDADAGVKKKKKSNKPIISSVLMLHSLLIPGPKPEKGALGYSLCDIPLPVFLTSSLRCQNQPVTFPPCFV